MNNNWNVITGSITDVFPKAECKTKGFFDDPIDLTRYQKPYTQVDTVSVLGYFGEDIYAYGYITYKEEYWMEDGYCFIDSFNGEINDLSLLAWRYMDDSEKYHE